MASESDENRCRIGLFVGKLCGGGAERAAARLSIYLSEYYDVYLIVYNAKNIAYEYKGKLIDIADDAGAFPVMLGKSIIKINHCICDNRLELVISFCDWPNIINGLFNHSCKKITSIRAHFEKGNLHGWLSVIKYPVIKRALEYSDMVWTLTEAQRVTLIRDIGIEGDRVTALGNIYDVDEIISASDESVGNIEILSFINDRTSIAVGRLCEQKNYFEMLEIFALVKEECRDARLLIFGKGKLKKKLINKAAELGLENEVLFGGETGTLFFYMKKCRLYISMTGWEGFPNSLIEAMAVGLPVIHSDCPTGPSEILDSLQGTGKENLPDRENIICVGGDISDSRSGNQTA